MDLINETHHSSRTELNETIAKNQPNKRIHPDSNLNLPGHRHPKQNEDIVLTATS